MNFYMMHKFYYSLTEIENMIPWEREVYVAMLTTYLKEEETRMKHNGNS